MKNFCESITTKPFISGNYNKLVQLVIVYLSDAQEYGFKNFQHLGALHKAHWLVKLMYSLKMCFLGQKNIHKLLKGTVFFFNQQDRACCFLLCPLVATASDASTTPGNLLLLKTLFNYNSIDATCASAAIKALTLYMWYLTEELVPLALFSSGINPYIKQKMVGKLKALPPKKIHGK